MHIWSVAIFLICLLIPTVFVRNLSKFSFTYLIGNVCIMTTIIVVSYEFISKQIEEGGKLGPGVDWIDSDFMMMLGFGVYAYEGIGVVLPIMSVCECPEKFDWILLATFVTLISIYIVFAELCYLTLGTDLKH